MSIFRQFYSYLSHCFISFFGDQNKCKKFSSNLIFVFVVANPHCSKTIKSLRIKMHNTTILMRGIVSVRLKKCHFFLCLISSFHLFVHALSWAWSSQGCQLLGMAGLMLIDVLSAGPISPGYRWCHNPFAKKKDSYSLFPVDGMLIPVKNWTHKYG